MKTIKINDIEVRYDDSICDAQLEKIITLIERYYEILIESLKSMNDGNSKCVISLVPTEEEKVFYFGDFLVAFNNFMEQILRNFFNDYYVDGSYRYLVSLFLQEYFNQEAQRGKKELLFDTTNISGISLSVWLIVIVCYFAEQCKSDGLKQEEKCIECCLEYINSSSGKVTNKIFNWVLNDSGMDLYDFCLGKFCDELSANGWPDNILEIVFAEYEKMLNHLRCLEQGDNKRDNDLENVDIDIDKLFFEFLDYINAPSEWRDYYDGLLEKRALTIEIVKDEHAGTKKQDEEGEQRANTTHVNLIPIIKNGKLQVEDISNIKIQKANKADAFIILVHEFIHYVNWNKLLDKVNEHLLLFVPRNGVLGEDEYKHVNDVVNMFHSQRFKLLEFPSIFFEKVSAYFLACKFPQKFSTSSLLVFRPFSELYNYIVFFYVWLDLKRRKEFNRIDKKNGFKPIELNDLHEKLNKILDEIDFNGWQDEVGIKRIPFYVRWNCSREDYRRESEDAFGNSFYDQLKSIVLGSDDILLCIAYALGNFLADYLIDQLDNDPTIIERMVRVVDEGTLCLEDITCEFNLYELFGQVPPGFERS